MASILFNTTRTAPRPAPGNRRRCRVERQGCAQPVHLQTFEFRLTASEAQEQCVAVGNPRSGHYIASTRCVRAYLTRTGDPSAASSQIGGVEVHAELRDGNLVCAAALSDFGPGDLVVVQVKAALYERGVWSKKRLSRKGAEGAKEVVPVWPVVADRAVWPVVADRAGLVGRGRSCAAGGACRK